MGIKLLILLALLVGVLYCLHILAQDYQAITAPKFLRLLFKRDLNSTKMYKPTVRWRMVLDYDPIQCARFLYCDLGAHLIDNEMQRGFVYMLTLNPKDEDETALDVFKKAYFFGKQFGNPAKCTEKYPLCPFNGKSLQDLLQYLLRRKEH